MILGDLLDSLRTEVLRDTSDAVGGDSDQLWSDTTLVRFIDQAQRRFARRSLVLRDHILVNTVAYQRDYPLPPGVFAVISARFKGNGQFQNGAFVVGTTATDFTFTPTLTLPSPDPIYPDDYDLHRGGHNEFMHRAQPESYYFDVNNLERSTPAKPIAYDTDEFIDSTNGVSGTMSLRLYPLPSVQYANCPVELRVVRLPLVPLTPQNLDAAPEVPEDYHEYLLDYAAHRALRIVDHEAGDPARAQEFLAMFEQHVEEARREMLRKMFAPQRWGFGQNAFTYTGN